MSKSSLSTGDKFVSILKAYKSIVTFVLDVSTLVNMKRPPGILPQQYHKDIAAMIRNAIIQAEFFNAELHILWPPSVPQEEMLVLHRHM